LLGRGGVWEIIKGRLISIIIKTMDKETYDMLDSIIALKRLIDNSPMDYMLKHKNWFSMVENWIDEVAKEYQDGEGKTCDRCGVKMSDLDYANGSGLCESCTDRSCRYCVKCGRTSNLLE